MIVLVYHHLTPTASGRPRRRETGFRSFESAPMVADFIAPWRHRYPEQRVEYYLFTNWQDLVDAGTSAGRSTNGEDGAWIQAPGLPVDHHARDRRAQSERAAHRESICKQVRDLVERRIATLGLASMTGTRATEAVRAAVSSESERPGARLGSSKPGAVTAPATRPRVSRGIHSLFVDD